MTLQKFVYIVMTDTVTYGLQLHRVYTSAKKAKAYQRRLERTDDYKDRTFYYKRKVR